jgi:hypothetical protein
MRSVSAIIGLLLALATTTPPRPAVRVPVYLHVSADDTVGSLYVDKLSQTIETSDGYRRVMTANDAQFVIGIVTMDPNEADLGAPGHSTVASITLQLENTKGLNYIVHSWVLIANRDKINSLASDLFAAIDKEIRDLH